MNSCSVTHHSEKYKTRVYRGRIAFFIPLKKQIAFIFKSPPWPCNILLFNHTTETQSIFFKALNQCLPLLNMQLYK